MFSLSALILRQVRLMLRQVRLILRQVRLILRQVRLILRQRSNHQNFPTLFAAYLNTMEDFFFLQNFCENKNLS
jgi:hypothetical protein